MSEKLTAKEYAEKLLYTPEYAADKQADVKEKAAAFAEGYKKFMDSAKTEREAAVARSPMKRVSVWSLPTSTAPVWTCVPTPCTSLTT